LVDARQKGARGETLVRDALRKLTGLNWERTPGSGALDAKHKLKGDLYIPDSKNNYCVEVKNYEDDHLTSKYLTSINPQISVWWAQTIRESAEVSRKPLLIFKFNRSKLFVAFQQDQPPPQKFIYLSKDNIYVMILDDFIKECKPQWQ
jgi:hypothetical protein